MSVAYSIPEEERRTYLGSHDTSAISGLNPYRQPINVFMDKLGMSIPQEPTERMGWGLALQPAILAEFAKRKGGLSLEPERLIRHDSLAWFGGTPDATIAGRKAGVDAKNVQFNRGDWGEDGTDQVPRYVLFQCHHFLALTGYEVWYVAALFSGCEMRIFEVERDAELADMIIEMDGEFWRENIEKQVPPEIDGSEGWKKYTERMHPKDNGEVRAATSEEVTILRAFKVAEEQAGEWEEKLDVLKNRLRGSIGDAAGIVCDIAKVSFRNAKEAMIVDKEKLEKEWPDIARKCLKAKKASRPLRVTFQED